MKDNLCLNKKFMLRNDHNVVKATGWNLNESVPSIHLQATLYQPQEMLEYLEQA